ncbi:MAG: hypothetical protein EHM33_12815 [Chloroflexi bacterium]|nr:MAG: hypothetical protein EHM33_12815 [Chloroflexota bacterium]
MKTLYILTLCLLTVSLASCNLPTSPRFVPVSPGNAGPQTWVDAPLDQMLLPLAPYEIVFHASDDSEITNVELQINDEGIAVPPLSDAGKNLVTVKYLWSPRAVGQYVLRARSQNVSGAWSDEAIVTVWIGDLTPTLIVTPVVTGSPTDIITPTDVITPTATLTPTLTPSPTFTPSPVGMTYTHGISASEFHYGHCNPTSIDITVTVSGGDADSVVLFIKLNDQGGSGTSGWISYNSMKPLGGGTYTITVVSSKIAGFDDFDAAWMVYQFVATKNNVVIGRSESFKDVVLTACSVSPLAPPPVRPIIVTIIPTNTPQIIK